MAAVQKYGQRPRLLKNQRYEIAVHLPGRQAHQFSFTSRYDPYYTATKIVQGDLGTVLKDVSVEHIAQAIWQQSLGVRDLMEQEMIPIPDKPSRTMQELTRYRTDYFLLLSVLSGRHANAGQEQRRLRDLTVTLQISRPQAESLLNRWKQLADEMEAELLDRPVLGTDFLKAAQAPFRLGRSF